MLSGQDDGGNVNAWRGGTTMQPKTDVTDGVERLARKVWCSPELRRLPIAATASSSKPEGNSNDGGGGGKGEVTGEFS